MERQRKQQLNHVTRNLIHSRGWRYLRYLHLRDFVANANRIESIGVCGAGLGFAELALALEFPNVEIILTDIVADGRPNYHRVADLSLRWDVRNIRFGIWDATQPAPRRFDAIASTEILEHIPDARKALGNMIEAANSWVYALTPFATAERNADADARVAAYREHEHIVCGYDPEFFEEFASFGQLSVHGTYWTKFGGQFRRRLMQASADEIDSVFETNCQLAHNDLRKDLPAQGECLGIKAIYRL